MNCEILHHWLGEILRSPRRQISLCLAAFVLLAGRAEAIQLSGSVSIPYSDGTTAKAVNVHVFAVKMRELNAYLKPLLPEAAKQDTVLRAEFTDLVMHYSAEMTDAEKQEYEGKKKQLLESEGEILLRLLTNFPGKTITSTTTDADGNYVLSISDDCYVTALVSANDAGINLHHIWLIPGNEIPSDILILDGRNQIPSATSLYNKFETSPTGQ